MPLTQNRRQQDDRPKSGSGERCVIRGEAGRDTRITRIQEEERREEERRGREEERRERDKRRGRGGREGCEGRRE